VGRGGGVFPRWGHGQAGGDFAGMEKLFPGIGPIRRRNENYLESNAGRGKSGLTEELTIAGARGDGRSPIGMVGFDARAVPVGIRPEGGGRVEAEQTGEPLASQGTGGLGPDDKPGGPQSGGADRRRG
jgi:hypothetical protein